MKKGNYVLNVRCQNCETLFRSEAKSAKFYNEFPKYVCGSCGSNRFYNVVERWAMDGVVWYKPSTWLEGYWEKAPEIEDKEDEVG